MKEYVRKEPGNSSVVLNDPQRGFVKKVFENKQKLEALKENLDSQLGGFGKNGDAMLTERFNPNNVELNSKRFQKQHADILKAK